MGHHRRTNDAPAVSPVLVALVQEDLDKHLPLTLPDLDRFHPLTPSVEVANLQGP